jgi:hypothetical protein
MNMGGEKMMLKPVCVSCQCFYRPHRNGYFFTEMMPNGPHHGPPEDRRGTKAPELWQPYKLWVGDLWQCPECAHELVVGVIAGPIAEHYQPDFNSLVERYGGNQLKVNDC